MVNYMTEDPRLVAVFMRATLRQRVATMLSCCLHNLVGRGVELKGGGAKVAEPEKYHFEPRNLLLEVAETFVHFADDPEFPAAIVLDERFYDHELFRKAVNRVLRPMMKEKDLKVFESLALKCQELGQNAQQEEEDLGQMNPDHLNTRPPATVCFRKELLYKQTTPPLLAGDIPDEFLCPITSVLMLDPVMLPTSKQMISRAAITRALLSDPIDPFSRAKLTVDMLVPQPELAQQIREWKEGRLAKARAAKLQGAEKMEVDE
ncbi:ubiquitin elongating factor core-domain-containing protein [Pavlovales sp. CCMP2436]|nr:ubiquitin elongating factor core-domain-containing protein [Pavlovales sp. CCMP2436]